VFDNCEKKFPSVKTAYEKALDDGWSPFIKGKYIVAMRRTA